MSRDSPHSFPSMIQQPQAQQAVAADSSNTYPLPSMYSIINLHSTSPSNMDVLASASLRDMQLYVQQEHQQQQQQPPPQLPYTHLQQAPGISNRSTPAAETLHTIPASLPIPPQPPISTPAAMSGALHAFPASLPIPHQAPLSTPAAMSGALHTIPASLPIPPQAPLSTPAAMSGALHTVPASLPIPHQPVPVTVPLRSVENDPSHYMLVGATDESIVLQPEALVEDMLCKLSNIGSSAKCQVLERLIPALTESELSSLSFSLVQKQTDSKGSKRMNWNRNNALSGHATNVPHPNCSVIEENTTEQTKAEGPKLWELHTPNIFPPITSSHNQTNATFPLLTISTPDFHVTSSTQTFPADSAHCETCQCPRKAQVEKPYECETCGKRFSKWRTLKIHMKRHTEDGMFQCELCEKSFFRSDQLEAHVLLHTNVRPYVCKFCGKAFRTKSYQLQHAKLHSGLKPHQCRYCNQGFTLKVNLRNHQKLHTGEADFRCELCSKCFIRRDYLSKHMTAVHSDKKAFTCSFCSKQFAWKNTLEKHEKMHTDTKSYPCELCGKVYPGTANLRMHMRIHSGQKPHECKFCGKRFIQKQDKTRHEMTHTGRKPHPCTYCTKSYIRRQDLKKHEKIHSELSTQQPLPQ